MLTSTKNVLPQTGPLLIILAFAGCTKDLVDPNPPPPPPPPPPAEQTAYIWLGAMKDTYVKSNTPSQNLGNSIWLQVGGLNNPFDDNAYIHFSMPDLPPGSEVREAYLNLFLDGEASFDTNFKLWMVGNDWSPLTMTWDSQPWPGGNPPNAFSYAMRIRSSLRGWHGSENIKEFVDPWLADQQSNHGLVIDWDRLQSNGTLTFPSNNALDRTSNDLARSPRLMLKVVLPEGTPASIGTPPVLPDTDLTGLASPVLIMEYRFGGDDFPAAWEVAKGF